ncbi:hypothetical protein [Ruegeria sp.]|uniref:hypothetical protein n=1 Tax=Ruegeria sp. TaxID=1879320 RepID=UPI003B5ADDA4
MSYDALLQWISGKRPIWLYRIRLGSTEEFLTSRAADFTHAPGGFGDPALTNRTWAGSPTRHTQIR